MGNKHSLKETASTASTPTSVQSNSNVSGNFSTKSVQQQQQSASARLSNPSGIPPSGALNKSLSFSTGEVGGAGAGDGVPTPVKSAAATPQHHQLPPLALLSTYQKNLIREAWQRIGKKGAGSIGVQIFRRMFDTNPDIKKIFQHICVIEGMFSAGVTSVQAYQHHSELFIEILDESIANIDDLNSIIPKLNEYGAKHAPFKAYGFKAEYWDIFGEAMIAAAREWEGWRKHRETLRAWTLLISFIVDRMRQGYEATVRRPGMLQQYSVSHSNHDSQDDPSSASLQTSNPPESTPTADHRRRAPIADLKSFSVDLPQGADDHNAQIAKLRNTESIDYHHHHHHHYHHYHHDDQTDRDNVITEGNGDDNGNRVYQMTSSGSQDPGQRPGGNGSISTEEILLESHDSKDGKNRAHLHSF